MTDETTEKANDEDSTSSENHGGENHGGENKGGEIELTNEQQELRDNVRSGSTWLRLFFMLIVGFIYYVTRVVLGAVVVLQFFWVLFSAKKNDKLLVFGQQLATFSYQMIRYLTFNTEERPFPFDLDWPAD